VAESTGIETPVDGAEFDTYDEETPSEYTS
jgi:hypothetical protein